MQRRILAADPGLDLPDAVPAEQQPAPSFAEPVARPCQLPPDLPDFVGRREEPAPAAAALTPSAEPDAARTLLGRAGGLPQVVQTLGERIASRPDWTPAVALERLHRPEPGSPVRPPECSAIEDPYDAMLVGLAPEQVRAFLLLSVPELPEVTPALAAQVLGLPLDAAVALVESLVDLHLLTATGPGAYAYVAPLRTFARHRARESYGPSRRDDAHSRVAVVR